MTMQYLKDRYGVPAEFGARVRVNGKLGTIKGTEFAYLKIQLDGKSGIGRYHPTWEMGYFVDGEWLEFS